jgi:hypothetical protein
VTYTLKDGLLVGQPCPEENLSMPIDPSVRRNWEEIQKKYDQPVNAIGVKIKPQDQATLKVWKQEGIDKFVKK